MSTSASPGNIRINAESLRLHFQNMISHIQNRVSVDTIRPLHVFLGLETVGASSVCLSAAAFRPPNIRKMDKSVNEKVTSRMKINFSYFLSNYAVVAAFVATVIALMHPGMILMLSLLATFWTLHHFLIRNEVELFGLALHRILSVKARSLILSVLTFVVVVWKCLKPTIFFVCISSILILLHAFLRDPKHVETTNEQRSTLALVRDDEAHDSSGGESSGSEVLVGRHRQDIV